MSAKSSHHVAPPFAVGGKQDGNLHETDYAAYLARLQGRFIRNIASGEPLFWTKTDSLYDTYLASIPVLDQQYHNCNACHLFLSRYGALVKVSAEGDISSVLWDEEDADGDAQYAKTARALKAAVEKSEITKVFLSEEKVWGLPRTGNWMHFGIIPPKDRVFRDRLLTSGQASAEKTQTYQALQRALEKYTTAILTRGLAILKSGSIPDAKGFIAQVEWLLALQGTLAGKTKTQRNNLVFKAVATGSKAMCQPSGTAVGDMLDNLIANLANDVVIAKFKAMTDPSVMHRAVAPAKAGAIARAESIFTKLGLATALNRRAATLEEVELFWQPQRAAASSAPTGIFGHLKPVEAPKPLDVTTKPIRVTFLKFIISVMPQATSMMVWLPETPVQMGGLTTAVNAEDPAIYQWDREDDRNPVAWYRYDGGAYADSFGLTPKSWVNLSGICKLPCEWKDNPAPVKNGCYLLLEGAVDKTDAGSMIFPEFLAADLREVRKVIEAHSRRAELQSREAGSANGIKITPDEDINLHVSVVISGTTRAMYFIDRWD